MTKTTFDIHLASDRVSAQFEERLNTLGFIKDDFIGGTAGVVHPCHYSKKPATRDAFIRSWNNTMITLSSASNQDFHGYAEAEATPIRFRKLFQRKPFNPKIKFPFLRLEHKECPSEKYKNFDIHITSVLSSLDSRLKQLLEEEIQFNYVDIRKPHDKIVRVYTFQTLGVKQTPHLYNLLLDYFEEAGGIDGKIKLEVTRAFARFPKTAKVPPVITSLPSLLV